VRVLVVDDDPDVTALVRAHITRLDDDLAVETVTNTRDAVDRVSEGDVDCVVSDYEMPRLTGLELLAAVREERGDLPFVMFTGKGDEEVARRARDRGATYVRKHKAGDGFREVADHVVANVGS
jgi:CheY-like chemotaxis protein